MPELEQCEVAYVIEMLNLYDVMDRGSINIRAQNNCAWKGGVCQSPSRKMVGVTYTRRLKNGTSHSGIRLQLIAKRENVVFDDMFLPFEEFRGKVTFAGQA